MKKQIEKLALMDSFKHSQMSRRRFVMGATSILAATAMPWSKSTFAKPLDLSKQSHIETLSGNQFKLHIGYQPVNFTGKQRIGLGVNGSVPAPILRFKEGQPVTLKVTNNLAEDSSIHWHGLILPTEMDGVPGLSFDGIKPGDTYTYKFDVKQNGTYWYHSHSGFQEQLGLYGAIVIDPIEPEPFAYDREYVVLLSDWSDEQPEDIYANLKKMNDYYNYRERTTGDLWRDIKEDGVAKTWNKRSMWNKGRMSESDLSDVTGSTYTYLMNGVTPGDGWKGLFKRGEKVRLRIINASAMSIFDIRIPGLTMKVVATDGQNIEPVSVDEFRIGVAETYDVIVEPMDDRPYCIFSQTIDRTGFARGSLTPDLSLEAEIPLMDPPAFLGHRDMGMAMSGMGQMDGMKTMGHSSHDMGNMKKNQMPMNEPSQGKMDHSNHKMGGMKMMDMKQPDNMVSTLGKAGMGSNNEIIHAPTEFGSHSGMRAQAPQMGINDPGIGLRDHKKRYGRKVLTYADIRNLHKNPEQREPDREIQLHLTGNMSRYMWSMNGIKFTDSDPVQLKYGEYVRITLVNDTMMTHPMHLHGMWSELETGEPNYIPRKHTVLVQPGSKVSYLVKADAKGRWAYHCHLLYHMGGMFREVRVS